MCAGELSKHKQQQQTRRTCYTVRAPATNTHLAPRVKIARPLLRSSAAISRVIDVAYSPRRRRRWRRQLGGYDIVQCTSACRREGSGGLPLRTGVAAVAAAGLPARVVWLVSAGLVLVASRKSQVARESHTSHAGLVAPARFRQSHTSPNWVFLGEGFCCLLLLLLSCVCQCRVVPAAAHARRRRRVFRCFFSGCPLRPPAPAISCLHTRGTRCPISGQLHHHRRQQLYAEQHCSTYSVYILTYCTFHLLTACSPWPGCSYYYY